MHLKTCVECVFSSGTGIITWPHTRACHGASLNSANDGHLFIRNEDEGYDAKPDERSKSKEDGTAEVVKPS